MFKSYFKSKKWALWAWGGLAIIVGAVYISVELSVWFNNWYKEFYDILQVHNDINQFWIKMQSFFWMAILYISISVLTTFLINHWTFRWRQAMTEYYLPLWEKTTSEKYEGSAQRIQEDTMRFARLVEDLGDQALNSVLTLIAFIPILLTLGQGVTIDWLKTIPGNLVAVAIMMSIGGLIISWFVGIKLPGLQYNNQKAEAAFRKNLVYCEDDKRLINQSTLAGLFAAVKGNYVLLFLHYTYFNTWKHFYRQFNIVLPYLLMGPSLFANVITLGVIVQTGNAFGKVQEAASFLLDRWVDVTELRSIHKRLVEFENAIQ